MKIKYTQGLLLLLSLFFLSKTCKKEKLRVSSIKSGSGRYLRNRLFRNFCGRGISNNGISQ
ncbi:MAG: hypothetical protein ACMUEM_01740 [Flavobacteriales bacterium AspAUS03]